MSLKKKFLFKTASGPAAPANTFQPLLYVGDRPTNAQKTGLNFQADLVVIKDRDADDFWSVLDSNRGQNMISWDSNNASSSFTFQFNSNGITIGSSGQANTNGNDYVAFCWRANGGTTSTNSDGNLNSTVQANVAAGFSVITYTGTTGSSKTIGHGLGVEPSMYMTKRTNHADAWRVTAKVIEGFELDMASNVAKFQDGAYPNYATSSVIKLGTGSAVHTNGGEYVTYCFADIAGLRKVGSYTGDGGTSHSINVGFQPNFFMVKVTSHADNWMVFDTVRGGTTNNAAVIFPNLNFSERNPNLGNGITFTATGVTLLSSDGALNGSGKTYMYWAEKIVT